MLKRVMDEKSITGLVIYALIMFIGLYVLLISAKMLLDKLGLYHAELVVPSAILVSILVALMSIYLNQVNTKENKEYDESKEQLIFLYGPLNAEIEKNEYALRLKKIRSDNSEESFKDYAVVYYRFFLKLCDIYRENQVYGSLRLFTAFRVLKLRHDKEIHNAIERLSSDAPEDALIEWVALFELKNGIREEDDKSEFERAVDELITIVTEDIAQIADAKKPLKRFFQKH